MTFIRITNHIFYMFSSKYRSSTIHIVSNFRFPVLFINHRIFFSTFHLVIEPLISLDYLHQSNHLHPHHYEKYCKKKERIEYHCRNINQKLAVLKQYFSISMHLETMGLTSYLYRIQCNDIYDF